MLTTISLPTWTGGWAYSAQHHQAPTTIANVKLTVSNLRNQGQGTENLQFLEVFLLRTCRHTTFLLPTSNITNLHHPSSSSSAATSPAIPTSPTPIRQLRSASLLSILARRGPYSLHSWTSRRRQSSRNLQPLYASSLAMSPLIFVLQPVLRWIFFISCLLGASVCLIMNMNPCICNADICCLAFAVFVNQQSAVLALHTLNARLFFVAFLIYDV